MNTKVFWVIMFLLMIIIGGCTGSCYTVPENNVNYVDDVAEDKAGTTREYTDQSSSSKPVYKGAVDPLDS